MGPSFPCVQSNSNVHFLQSSCNSTPSGELSLSPPERLLQKDQSPNFLDTLKKQWSPLAPLEHILCVDGKGETRGPDSSQVNGSAVARLRPGLTSLPGECETGFPHSAKPRPLGLLNAPPRPQTISNSRAACSGLPGSKEGGSALRACPGVPAKGEDVEGEELTPT